MIGTSDQSCWLAEACKLRLRLRLLHLLRLLLLLLLLLPLLLLLLLLLHLSLTRAPAQTGLRPADICAKNSVSVHDGSRVLVCSIETGVVCL